MQASSIHKQVCGVHDVVQEVSIAAALLVHTSV